MTNFYVNAPRRNGRRMMAAVLTHLSTEGASTACTIARTVKVPGSLRERAMSVNWWLLELERMGRVWRINPGHTPLIWRIEE